MQESEQSKFEDFFNNLDKPDPQSDETIGENPGMIASDLAADNAPDTEEAPQAQSQAETLEAIQEEKVTLTQAETQTGDTGVLPDAGEGEEPGLEEDRNAQAPDAIEVQAEIAQGDTQALPGEAGETEGLAQQNKNEAIEAQADIQEPVQEPGQEPVQEPASATETADPENPAAFAGAVDSDPACALSQPNQIWPSACGSDGLFDTDIALTGIRNDQTEELLHQALLELARTKAGLAGIQEDVRALSDSSAKTAGEVREIHRLYHNEFATRLKSMADELERYREIEKGRVFDSVLGEVAKLYADYESVLGELEGIEDEKAKKARKRIGYMFDDIAQILDANGVMRQKSNPGDRRNTRHCQVVGKIETSDPGMHDTVAESRGTGFFVENRSLIKEPVTVYLYSETTGQAGDPDKNQETNN